MFMTPAEGLSSVKQLDRETIGSDFPQQDVSLGSGRRLYTAQE